LFGKGKIKRRIIMKKISFIGLSILVAAICSAQTIPDGHYFGQTPPGDSAVIFAPGVISLKDRVEFGIIFSSTGDELFLNIFDGKKMTALHSKLIGSTWSKFDTAFFAREGGVETITISPDGKLLTFTKSNPIAGWPYNTDLYFCTRTDTGWSQPQPFSKAINSEFREAGHALTLDRTLYFASGRPTDDRKADIIRAKCINGEYTSAEYVPNLSTPADEDAVWISPDESYAIVESWQDANKKDLYLSFRKQDNSWTKLINMGPKINTASFEGIPKVSRDGKYLFFWSDRNGNIDIYWIRVEKIIEDLKKQLLLPD
jgi:hypothetical protein